MAAVEMIKDLEWKKGKISKVIPKEKIYKAWQLCFVKDKDRTPR